MTEDTRVTPQTALTMVLSEIFDSEVWDDPPVNTAARVLNFWMEYMPRPQDFEATTFPVEAQQMISVVGIEFTSICAHHLLPFFGVAHVAYLPHRLQIGVSKIPRVVRWLSKSPQVQERLTNQIADWMQDTLEPKGTSVIMSAIHTCMACRGVMSRNSRMVTSEMRGIFLSSGMARDEFYQVINNGGLK
jgi:GTP cyclohydrolase I